MKTKILISLVLLLFVSEAYSQFKVNSDGSAQFKVNNIFAGFTGNHPQSNVSFGYGASHNQLTGNYNTAIDHGATATGSYQVRMWIRNG